MNSELSVTFDKLCKELGLEESPPTLLTGESAINFVTAHYAKRNKKLKPSLVNGTFIYENIDEDYVKENNLDKSCIKNGLVCLIKEDKSTLIHEMRHAYQFKHKCAYLFIENDEQLQKEYKKTYAYYPAEEDAFKFTIDYMEKEMQSESTGKLSLLDHLNIKNMKFNLFMYKLNYALLKVIYYYGYKKMSLKKGVFHLQKIVNH